MFTCLWQLWDWLDPPPIFTTATMESKKLQQMQQANTHLIPQPMPQIKAPLFHQVTGDYGPHSPVFQNVPQYNSVTSNFAQIERTGHHQPRHHSSQHHLAPSSNNHLHIKPLQNSHSSMLSSYTAHRQTQPTGQSLYGTDSVYQNNRDRHYQQSALRTQPTSQHNHSHPMNKFQSEYQQLQQAKIQQQIQTQNEALIQQQRTFAIRQQLNPPIPQSHMHNLQSSQNLRSIPPSTLNLTTQFQPASGPSDSNNDEKIYGAQRNYNQTSPNSVQSQSIYHQKQKSNQQLARQKMQESSPSELTPIIQQNHPDLVVNQACQTQIPETIASKSKSQTESPVHQSLERKKSSGTIQSLKSPVTKRPASAPVTLSGWLYKQGSEGLKVWRKRWFVLSEYCLYYYKGPEEEKLLGSILLPSYRVAACLPEDKIYRKFAFKCEHQNMRTYWLSAETSEIMGHWIRALTAATVMQSSSESSDHVSQPSFSSLNPSGENSDSGILTYQSQQSKISALQSHGPVTPAMDTGGPLYANAPPKPRRANDGGYSSPSPENSIDRYEPSFDKNKYFDSTAQPQSYHPQHMLNSPISQTHLNEPIYGSQHLNKSNSMQNHKFKNNWETSNSNQIKSPYGQDMQQQDLQNLLSFSSELYQSNRDNIIRAPHRFEDYGRKHFNEQNDVDTYGMQPLLNSRQKYELQMEMNNSERRTPDTYGRSRIDQINRNLMDYEDIYNLNSQPDMNVYRRPTSPPSHKNLQTLQHLQGSSQRAVPSKLEQKQNVRMRRPVQSIPRPHSADFLEYETRMESANNPVPEMMRAPRPKSSLDINRTPDNFYYSEASYAEKMRQSALYLQKTPSGLYGKDKHSEVLKQSNSRGDISGHNMGYNTIPGESGFVMHSDSKHNNSHTPRNHRSYNKNVNLQNEQFLRSASVRLPRKADDTGMRDSEQKREESMKRLLEWKQRMLQSPLTRKGVPISLAMDAKTPLSVKTANITQGIQRSRSATNANNAGYNSYSSDDEASISVQNVRNVHNSHINLRPDYTYEAQLSTKNKHHTDYSADIYSDKFGRNRKTHSHQEPDPPERNFQNIAAIRNMDMSAGDLLSRTHEELVLLLIQLRRQNCATARSIEQCCTDIHEVQNRIRTCETDRDRSENLARLDSLKQHLVDFEKQYEKSKPLVNLVDNMVKLGSLYRNGSSQNIPYSHESVTLDRLEFNQRMQEKRLLQEDQKYWDRLSPNHNELQTKVQQLYQLDQLLQEESGTLQNLQRDKEDLERSLGNLRNKLQHGGGTPYAMEVARKQQHDLERELSRVHQLLAENSKKLEQTVAGNAKLEKDLLVLRQKLQATKESRGSQSALGSQEATDSIPYVGGATAMLESELRRVQQLVGDMQRQRHDLSQAVRQLTENSNTLNQQIKPADHSSQSKKRNLSTSWTETDLDSMISTDHQLSSSIDNISINTQDLSASTYLNNRSGNLSSLNCSTSDNSDFMYNKLMGSHKAHEFDAIECSEVENDDFSEGNLHNQDKQEIKTVRIVKRESERRHRDRERTNANSSINLDHVVEEDILNTEFNRSKSLPRTYLDKHDLYASQLTDKKLKSPKSVQHLPTTSAFSPNSVNSMNYNDYYNSLTAQYPMSTTEIKDKPEGINVDHYLNNSIASTTPYTSQNPKNPFLTNLTTSQKTDSIQSLNKAIGDLSPVFQSEAARQIITEMSGTSSEENSKKNPLASKQRRAIPREKRRHYTAPSNTLGTKSTKYVQSENDMNKNNINWRARDDLDMEVALRPRVNAPDVVRSALGQCEKISENSIDKLFAAPSKIVIPERYIPEQPPELSPEEKKRRQEKVEAIKKMLSENTTNDSTTLPPSQISAEKKQREHLLQLNQILAEQVMQMSKIVAERAMASVSKNTETNILSEDDLTSPVTPLPIYQQRDNFFC
ncbi:probable serine/threonine-protein kinase DDB_G0272282 isoform X2 [Bradysia coprophila]|uniref:probable serine/threonine-protein kinase DDB_G0272282 isoform X2 n=1 Tax=Bradysia coprophila TaxID=38358 RepID=UPI00187DBD38|nr:probable serine/threonine-protein kinase DDB_G0272282 isoform X2 [Bradysia coprophila]